MSMIRMPGMSGQPQMGAFPNGNMGTPGHFANDPGFTGMSPGGQATGPQFGGVTGGMSGQPQMGGMPPRGLGASGGVAFGAAGQSPMGGGMGGSPQMSMLGQNAGGGSSMPGMSSPGSSQPGGGQVGRQLTGGGSPGQFGIGIPQGGQQPLGMASPGMHNMFSGGAPSMLGMNAQQSRGLPQVSPGGRGGMAGGAGSTLGQNAMQGSPGSMQGTAGQMQGSPGSPQGGAGSPQGQPGYQKPSLGQLISDNSMTPWGQLAPDKQQQLQGIYNSGQIWDPNQPSDAGGNPIAGPADNSAASHVGPGMPPALPGESYTDYLKRQQGTSLRN